MRRIVLWKTRRVFPPFWLRVMLFAAPLIAAFFLPGGFADPDGRPWPLLAVFAFMAICMWPLAFAAHWIEGWDEGLRIRYWPILSRAVSFADIASVDFRACVSPWEFGGIGLRLASRGILAFANRTGPGVEIHTHDGRSYFVTLNDPQELTRVRNHITHARHSLDQTPPSRDIDTKPSRSGSRRDESE